MPEGYAIPQLEKRSVFKMDRYERTLQFVIGMAFSATLSGFPACAGVNRQSAPDKDV